MMLKRLLLLLVLVVGGALLPACQSATPPIVGPNIDADEEGPGLTATPPSAALPGGDPSDDAADGAAGDSTDSADGAQGETALTPSMVIASASGAFTAGESVLVGVDLPANFSGVAPLVGEASSSTESALAETRVLEADDAGAVAFGVYVTASTTPGDYALFAEAADTGEPQYDVTITLTAAE